MDLPWKQGVVCLLREKGKTYFIDYNDYPHVIHQGKISPPGGKIEPREDPEDATVREVREEVGAIVLKQNLVYRATVHFNNENRTVNGKPMKFNMTVRFYDCSTFDSTNMIAHEGKLELLTDEEALTRNMHEGDRKVFEWLKKYKEFEGTIIQTGEKLTSYELKRAVPFSAV
jgi:8-oxo-dGTP pyrophosphatase MutT (NUDIX family)